MKMIKGRNISLRASTLDDRHMVYDWCYNSDIAQFLHLSDEENRLFDRWCESWKEYYFTNESPELGRVFIIEASGVPLGTISYNDIDAKNRVELDIWMNSEANCGKGFGTDAIQTICSYLRAEFGVKTFMMQPSARNPRAIRAYEKAGFVKVPATPEEIRTELGGVDHHDSVLMIRDITQTHATDADKPRR